MPFCLGRTPLHVAAGTNASAAVIELMAHAYPPACDVQDSDGRTPLHYASDAHCELFQEDEGGIPPRADAIMVLVTTSLDSAVLEDNNKTAALEYAIMSDAPLEAVTLLQRATQMVMRQTASPEAQEEGSLSTDLNSHVRR